MHETYDEHCLYFAANTLARKISKLADEAFVPVGIPASYAYLLIYIQGNPSALQSELADGMHLKPSTITRFVDKLVKADLIVRKKEGRVVTVSLTNKGEEVIPKITSALKNLHDRYCELLGEAAALKLIQEVYQANNKLE